jgi:hypothetical protein
VSGTAIAESTAIAVEGAAGRRPGSVEGESNMQNLGQVAPVKVQFKPVGRNRREWMWKARDESNTIAISGQRFDSLSDAVRDARTQLDVLAGDDGDDDGPYAA